MLYDKLLDGLKHNPEYIRKIVYGNNIHCEVEAMRLFIELRQDWVIKDIKNQINEN